MKSSDLKEYILEQDHIVTILEDLGCGNITKRDGYYACSNPDGNNKNAVTVYLNENLTTVNYTRNIANNKTATDIFDLVSFYKDCTFPEALKYVHNLLGLDYYGEKEVLCESLELLKMFKDMELKDEDDDERLRPLPEEILSYYLPYGNVMLEDDNISIDTQHEFEVCFDPQSNSICFPI